MFVGKTVFLAAILALAAAASDNDLTLCNGNPERVTFTTRVVAEPKDLQDVVEVSVTSTVDTFEFHPINCLRVINQNLPSEEGYPTVEAGGLGAYETSIRFVSQAGKPINYTIEIVAPALDGEDRSF